MPRIYLVDAQRYDKDWPPEEVEKFSYWLSELIKRCPIEYRSSMMIEFDTGILYDDTATTVKVYYTTKDSKGR